MKADSAFIKWLLNQEISKYQISKETGIHITTLTNLTDGRSLIENLSLKNAAALTEAAERLIKDSGLFNFWTRNGYYVEERAFSNDLHKFVIVVDGTDMAEIVPDSIEDMNEIIIHLNNGEEAVGMADRQGGEIQLPFYYLDIEAIGSNRDVNNTRFFETYSRSEIGIKYQQTDPRDGYSLVFYTMLPNGEVELISEKDYRD